MHASRGRRFKSFPVHQMIIDFLEARYIPEPNSGCWLWIGEMNRNGYGRFKDPRTGRYIMAHRRSFEVEHGRRLPRNRVLDHKCRVRSCINPAHLQPRSGKVNTLLGKGPTAVNARKRSCIRGHRLAGKNLYRTPEGYRACRRCKANRARAKRLSGLGQPLKPHCTPH